MEGGLDLEVLEAWLQDIRDESRAVVCPRFHILITSLHGSRGGYHCFRA